MIANDQELGIVFRQRQELKAQRDSLLREGMEKPLQLHVEVAGMEKMIARLREELDAYDSRKSGQESRWPRWLRDALSFVLRRRSGPASHDALTSEGGSGRETA